MALGEGLGRPQIDEQERSTVRSSREDQRLTREGQGGPHSRDRGEMPWRASRTGVVEWADCHVLTGMIVGDRAGDAEARRGAEVTLLEDDALGKEDARK